MLTTGVMAAFCGAKATPAKPSFVLEVARVVGDPNVPVPVVPLLNVNMSLTSELPFTRPDAPSPVVA